ncbi:hypothetical protein LCM00_19015 [Bacillus infantis]|uniref:lipopolysaccharide biosynthesis protein n=1 Tax=Bacillus infantis TaxID=324767 RepID=UPI001CD5C629|nr:hypothetical protein [Bacillus infantis]MCA1041612.1 hypothetical protein [Bacillus infantis]
MNRTKLVAVNSFVSAISMIINFILGIIQFSLFIKVYGNEINGLIQTASQTLSYLSLIESGLAAAYLYAFYKPMARGDLSEVSSLYTGFKLSMKSVVFKMLIVAFFISLFYPLIINDKSLGYLNMVIIFLLLSIKFVLPYFLILVPKQLIILKEQKYKVELIEGVRIALVFIIEIMLLTYFDISIYLLLTVSIIVTLLSSFSFNVVVKSLYGETLKSNEKPNKTPNQMSKDLLVHNISGMAMGSSTGIILSISSSLTNVLIFSAYNKILTQVVQFMQKIIEGATATIGLKISNDDKSVYNLFREILTAIMFSSTLITIVFITTINHFVELWIGKEYLLDSIDVFMLGIIMFANIFIQVLYIARNAKGLYKQSRNFTAFQAILNIILTFALVPIYGITGALIAIIISRFIVGIPMNYKLIYKEVFYSKNVQWFELIINVFIIIILSLLNRLVINNYLQINNVNLWVEFAIQTTTVTLFSTTILTIYYWKVSEQFQHFIKRLMALFKNIRQ